MVLVSANAIESRWLYFEAGGAYFAGKRVIPVCCCSFPTGELGTPLNWLQAVNGSDSASVSRLIQEIALLFQMRTPRTNIADLVSYLCGDPCTNASQSQLMTVAEIQQIAVPIYIVIDSSGSMSGERIEVLSRALNQLLNELRGMNERSLVPLVSFITFNDEARVLVPLLPIHLIGQLPLIHAEGTTSLGAALRLVAMLVSDQTRVPQRSNPPVIIILTDGQPTDDWRSGFDVLNRTPEGFRAIKVGVALGADADTLVLHEFAGDAVLNLSRPEDMAAYGEIFRQIQQTISSSA